MRSDWITYFLLMFFVFVHVTSLKIEDHLQVIKPKYYPPTQIKRFHLGFNSIFADSFWIRVIQDIEFCENMDAPRSVNKGIGIDDVLIQKLDPSRCNKGWVFQYLDLITDLAPRFKRVYRLGGEMLSVAVDDREGARLIFEKGLTQFPDYWELAYSAAYHYLFEFKNPSRAADLMVQAADNGGPFWFRQMAGTFYTKAGQYVMAETVLKKYIDEHQDIHPTERAKMRLKELHDEIEMNKTTK